MDTYNVVSAPAATNLNGKEFRVVKVGSAGIDLCDSASSPIGTLLRGQNVQEDGVYAGKAVAVQLCPASIHFAMIGASSAAIACGASLVLDAAVGNEGKLIPGAAPGIAKAWDSFNAADGAIVRVVFL
jgi:hypothetical protein